MKTEVPWPAIFAKAHKILSRQHPADSACGVRAAVVRDGLGVCLIADLPESASPEFQDRLFKAAQIAATIFDLMGTELALKKPKATRKPRPQPEAAPEPKEDPHHE